MAPKKDSCSRFTCRWSPTTTSMPTGTARVRSTSMVWGRHSSDTKKRLDSLALPLRELKNMVMASAAAVLSSRREALAISMPVRSITMVW